MMQFSDILLKLDHIHLIWIELFSYFWKICLWVWGI